MYLINKPNGFSFQRPKTQTRLYFCGCSLITTVEEALRDATEVTTPWLKQVHLRGDIMNAFVFIAFFDSCWQYVMSHNVCRMC